MGASTLRVEGMFSNGQSRREVLRRADALSKVFRRAIQESDDLT
jgi:hypothetical protein